MFIAMNRFTVKSDQADAFLKHWAERESQLPTQDGFVRFRMLRQAAPGRDPNTCEFVSYSEWVDRDFFLGWIEGPAGKASHSKASGISEMLAGPPNFNGFDIALDEGPGHRTDFRSPGMDALCEQHFSKESKVQTEIRTQHKEQNLPTINIGPFEGRMLEVLLRSIGAKRGLELGTLGGYSGSWLARALPDGGKLITVELEQSRAEAARKNFERLGLSHKVEVRVGAALDVISMADDLRDLDFVFIDADKNNYGRYVEWAIGRLRKGGLILADNAYLWGGMNYFGREPGRVKVSRERGFHDYSKAQFEGMSHCWSQLAYHPDLCSIILPTGEGLGVGVKV
jgi:predicted O-methyltransferase YrrM/heme-degrading monooxygenase HmoA